MFIKNYIPLISNISLIFISTFPNMLINIFRYCVVNEDLSMLPLYPKFILIPTFLHLQSYSSNPNGHYILEYLNGELESGESLLPLLPLSILYRAARTIL